MAESSEETTVLDRRIRGNLVKSILIFIKMDYLDGIKELFKSLLEDQRIQVLNSTVRGCLPLYVAVKDNKFDISSYLIEQSATQGRREMSEIWKSSRHPFIAAVLVGNPELMKLILRNLYDINDGIYGHLSPLMVAVYLRSLICVQIIVAMGADINRPCIHGRTPLMNSTSEYDICCFLISRGANINYQDEEGFTALHLAVTNYTIPCTNHLINAGADVRIQNNEGINPLTWAAMNINDAEVYRLFYQPAYSKLVRIESLEVLNACCACAQNVSLLGWKKALQMRKTNGLPKNSQIPTNEIFDFSKEFTTETELERIRDNPLRLAFQGILVIERIFGRNNRLYIQLLLQTALIAKERRHFVKLKQLIDYIQESCQETSFVANNFWYFGNVFKEIAKDGNSHFFFEYGGFTLFKIIVQATIKMWTVVKDHVYKNPFLVDRLYSELVDTFLYMTCAIGYLKSYQPYVGQFEEEVNKVVKEDLRHLHHHSLLHRTIKLMIIDPEKMVSFLKVLLESGADGNAKDYYQRTPIMYAFLTVPEYVFDDVLDLFKSHGYDSHRERSEYQFSVDGAEEDDCQVGLNLPRQ